MSTKYYRDGKGKITFTPKKGDIMDTCATISDAYICCNVKVIKSVSNCPFDCSYCFLQDYLNDGRTKVVSDIPAILAEIKETIEKEPQRVFRIGTWELGDSLALEIQTGQATALIDAFRSLPNALLELKTKSDVVDPILGLDHGQKTVVSWSLNTTAIIDKEEHKTASLTQRLAAMKKVVKAGYLVGIHIDPMIHYANWQDHYRELVDAIFKVTPPEHIAWISMGSLRFKPDMKQKMETNFPGSSLTAAEMTLGSDGKLRYPKSTRIAMYTHLLAQLNRYVTAENLMYLCMERWDVWEAVFGQSPQSIAELDYLFAKSLYTRYPKLDLPSPNQANY